MAVYFQFFRNCHTVFHCDCTNFSSIQFISFAQSCLTLCDPTDCSTPGLPIHHQLPGLTQIHVHWVGDVIQPFHPLSSPFSPAFSLSQYQGLFKWVSSLHQVAKVLSFSFSISSSNEYSGLIYFRIDWFDLLAVQGTLRRLLQHHSLKASVLQHWVFFMVQLSQPYMATIKTMALTIWIIVSKLMSLLFNMLSRFLIAFFPRSKCLLISRLQSLSTLNFGAQENKVRQHFHYLPQSDGTRCHDLCFLNVKF